MRGRMTTGMLFVSLGLGLALGLGLSKPLFAHSLQTAHSARPDAVIDGTHRPDNLRMLVAADFDVFLPIVKRKPDSTRQASSCQHKLNSLTQREPKIANKPHQRQKSL